MQVVVVPVANMYSKPTEKADVVSQAIYGSNVKLLESRGEWSRIETADHYRGWTPSRYLRIILTGDGYATAGPTVQVESLFANIYAEPDVTKHKPVVTIPFEAKLEVVPGDPKGSGKGTSKGHRRKPRRMAARPPCRADPGVDSSQRCSRRAEAADDSGIDRTGQTISGVTVSVGRAVKLWIRLRRVYADAGAGPRDQYAARCGSAGGVERSGPHRAQESAGG